MCKYCEDKYALLEKEFIETSIIGWDRDMLATDLFGYEYIESIFIDRGFLRLIDKNKSQCLDHGAKIKINYCPMCGRKLGER